MVVSSLTIEHGLSVKSGIALLYRLVR